MLSRKLILSFIAVFVLLSFGFVVVVDANPSVWSQTYGGTSYDQAESLVETSDGGYAIAGFTHCFGAGEADFWLVKVDSEGNMEWNKTYGGPDYEWARSLIETSDGGYALAGYTRSFGAGEYDFWLVKTDAYGNMEWNKTYGGPEHELFTSLVVTSDGGYALAGSTAAATPWASWLVKTDAYGNMEWNKTYGGTELDSVYSLVEASDGGYALAGTKFYLDAGESATDLWLLKTDAFGNMEWNQTYEVVPSLVDRAFSKALGSLVATSDGGYAITGVSSVFGSEDFWLVKTDAAGSMEWNQTYGGPDLDWPTSLITTSDGGYTLAGTTNSSGAGDRDFWLIKTDSSGNMEWKKTYGGTEDDMAYSLIATSNGGYVLAGFTRSFGAGEADFWLVKTEGCVNTYEYDLYKYDFDFGYYTYTVIVATNSTLGNFDFGLYENQISFSVTGPNGTTGFCKIIIPEELVGNNFPVYLNEVLLVEGVDYTRIYNSTHTTYDITYSHSTHVIAITGTNVVPEYSSCVLLSIMLVTTFVVVIYKKKFFDDHPQVL